MHMCTHKSYKHTHMQVEGYDACREVSDLLKQKHASAVSTLEQMVLELSGRFNPRQEERLLAVVNALLHR